MSAGTADGSDVEGPETRGRDERLEVGLLLCDHLDPDAAAVAGDYTELFPAAFAPVGLDLRIYDVTAGDLPVDPGECRYWMTSGSRRSAYEDEGWISELSRFVARLAAERRPHVGICFGHQLTALALGGEVVRSSSGWGVGIKHFELVGSAPWISDGAAGSGEPGGFSILMSHQDQVTRLPRGAELLARSDYCPVGAYRVADHVFCVQGHPEFVPELSRYLTAKRRSVIGEATADEALAGLDDPTRAPDGRVVRWIADFYRVPRGDGVRTPQG